MDNDLKVFCARMARVVWNYTGEDWSQDNALAFAEKCLLTDGTRLVCANGLKLKSKDKVLTLYHAPSLAIHGTYVSLQA